MGLICIKPIDGFTVSKTYKLLGCAGEMVELINDNKEKVIVFETCFETVL